MNQRLNTSTSQEVDQYTLAFTIDQLKNSPIVFIAGALGITSSSSKNYYRYILNLLVIVLFIGITSVTYTSQNNYSASTGVIVNFIAVMVWHYLMFVTLFHSYRQWKTYSSSRAIKPIILACFVLYIGIAIYMESRTSWSAYSFDVHVPIGSIVILWVIIVNGFKVIAQNQRPLRSL